MTYEITRLVEALTVPSLMVMVLLAFLTMRAIVKRDQAMMFGKGQALAKESEARRRSYEQTWRNNRLTRA